MAGMWPGCGEDGRQREHGHACGRIGKRHRGTGGVGGSERARLPDRGGEREP